jgi:hypothetical protein
MVAAIALNQQRYARPVRFALFDLGPQQGRGEPKPGADQRRRIKTLAVQISHSGAR